MIAFRRFAAGLGLFLACIAAPSIAVAADPPPENVLVKFAINARTGQIVFGDEFSFHEVLANAADSNLNRDGFVWGECTRIDGKLRIQIGTQTIRDPVLQKRWQGDYLASYLKTTFKDHADAKPFEGGQVFVDKNAKGYYDATRGLTDAPPQAPVPAAGGKQVFVFGERQDEPRTLDELRQGVVERRQRARTDSDRVVRDAYHAFIFAIDLESGNVGFADRNLYATTTDGGPMHVELAEWIRPPGAPAGPFVAGNVEYDHDRGRWVMLVGGAPATDKGVGADWTSVTRWNELMAQVLERADAPALNGVLLELGGRELGTWDVKAKRLRPEAESLAESKAEGGDFFPPRRPGPERAAGEADAVPEMTPPERAATEAPPVEWSAPEPAAIDPDLEQRIEALLRRTPLERLDADLTGKVYDFLQSEEFRPAQDSEAGRVEVRQAWKKVCSKPEWSEHGARIAALRRAKVVDLFAERSLAHQIRVDLLDSGRRNGMRSDLDMTVHSPAEGRAVGLAALLDEARSEFRSWAGYDLAALNVELHDGDLFIPDVRNRGMSAAAHAVELRAVVEALHFKVTAGGDAYYVPGGNLEEVQKPALREGTVTTLVPQVVAEGGTADAPARTRIVKPEPVERPIGALDPQPGAWRFATNAVRYEGVAPVYDRRNAFGTVAQSLEEILRNGDDPGAVAKYFNRAMGKGVGAGLVSTFYELHVSDLPEGEAVPSAATIRLAFDLEGGRVTADGARPSKTLMKTRWLIRAFALDRAGDPDYVARLYETVDLSARMEAAKNAGSLAWDVDRNIYLARYMEDARGNVERLRPDLVGAPEIESVVVKEAWRLHCVELRGVLATALVKTGREALADLSPEGLRRNAFRFAHEPGTGIVRYPDAVAAEKLAQQRRVELLVAAEIVARVPDDALRARLEAELFEGLPQSLRPSVEALLRLGGAELDHHLRGLDPAGVSPDEMLRIKRERVAEATRGLSSDASTITDDALRDHVARHVLSRIRPEDAAAARKMLAEMRGWGRDFKAEVLGNFAPLMLGSTAVGLVEAWQLSELTGNDLIWKEAVIREAFFLLPTTYGVLGVSVLYFGRGQWASGLLTIGTIAALRYAPPGAGVALLVFDITTTVPRIAYVYIVHTIDRDLVEQALRSRPVGDGTTNSGIGLVRAERNPFKDSSDVFRGGTPAVPLLFDHVCEAPQFGEAARMKSELDGKTVAELRPLAHARFLPAIWRDLVGAGLTPSSPNWEEQHERLLLKYAFDLPYYARVAKIYDCFFPTIHRLRDREGWDEEDALRSVFGEVVDKWFAAQPADYRSAFDAFYDVFGIFGTRQTLLDALRDQLVRLYKSYEQASFEQGWKQEELERQAVERSRELAQLEKRVLAAKAEAADRLEQALAREIASRIAGRKDERAARVRVVPPGWYVGLAPPVPSGEPLPPTAQAPAPLETIRLDVVVEADRSLHPEPWETEVALRFEEPAAPLAAGAPPGFVPNAIEKALLERKDDEGRPEYAVFTTKLLGEAAVFFRDERGQRQELGRAEPAPVVGYVVAPIPRHTGGATVRVKAKYKDADGKEFATYVHAEVRVGDRDPRETDPMLLEPTTGVAYVGELEPGTYAVDVRPLEPDYGPGSAQVVLEDPYTAAVYAALEAGGQAPPSVVEVTVELPFTGRHEREPEEAVEDDTATSSAEAGAGSAGDDAGSSGDTGAAAADPALVSECQGLLDQARQAAANSAAEGRRLVAAARGRCSGIDPGIDSALEDAERAVDEEVAADLAAIELGRGLCELEAALDLARDVERSLAGHPAADAWLAANLAALERDAENQRLAREILVQAQQALEADNLSGSIGLLGQAGALAPDCMRDRIASLRGELERRRLFGELTTKAADAANVACDFDAAIQHVGQIAAIQPREDYVAAWLDEHVPKLDDLRRREREARELLAQASAAAATADEPAEWDAVISLLEQADAVAPDCVRTGLGIDGRIADARRRRLGPPIETSMVLLIDTSGSMEDNGKIGRAKEGAKEVARNASKTTEIAVVSFSGDCGSPTTLVHGFSSDVASLTTSIDSLRPGGGTPMYPAVAWAVDYAQREGRGKQRLVVLLGDGQDSCAGSKPEAANAVRSRQIPVNTIGLDIAGNQQAQDDLAGIAGLSGGRSLSATSPDELVRAFKAAAYPALLKKFEQARVPAEAAGRVAGHFEAAEQMAQRQDFKGALAQYELAHGMVPDSSAIDFNLSLLYEADDQLIAAAEHARSYLRLEPNALDRGDVEQRIAALEEELERNPRVQYDTAQCRDLYLWARNEQTAAKKSGNAARRQAVLEILIAAQRGDCEPARKLAEEYRQRFGG